MQIEKGKIYATMAGSGVDQPTLYVGLDTNKVMTGNDGFVEVATIRAGADLSDWVELDQDAVAEMVLNGPPQEREKLRKK